MVSKLFACIEVTRISLQRDFPAVAHQIVREIAVSVYLMIIAVKRIKAMEFGHSGCSPVSKSPFSEAARLIPGIFQDLGDGDVFPAQSQVPCVSPH